MMPAQVPPRYSLTPRVAIKRAKRTIQVILAAMTLAAALPVHGYSVKICNTYGYCEDCAVNASSPNFKLNEPKYCLEKGGWFFQQRCCPSPAAGCNPSFLVAIKTECFPDGTEGITYYPEDLSDTDFLLEFGLDYGYGVGGMTCANLFPPISSIVLLLNICADEASFSREIMQLS